MKIKKLAIIILMTTFFIIIGTNAYATTGTINNKTVNLKKQPDSKTILEYLNKGDEVEILEYKDGWYKVKAQTELGRVTGYVSEEFIDTDSNTNVENPKPTEPTEIIQQPEEDAGPITTTDIIEVNIQEKNNYIMTKEVGIKALPLINSIEKSKISGNITVLEIINEWVRIENETDTGWIRKNILKTVISNTSSIQEEEKNEIQQEQEEQQPTDTTISKPEATPTQEEKINKVGYVGTDGLRVRKGPSTNTEEITSLSKNDKVEIIGQEGKWYKIDLDGEIGYVSAKYISDTKLPDTTSRSGSTLKNEEINKTEEQIKEKNEEDITSTNETTATTGEEIVKYAKQYLGYKYVSGGTTPSSGFDCSGFTQYVYKHFGISVNRTSGAQINNGVEVEKKDLQLGDLVIFNNDANTSIGHVGIYVGNGNFIHASNPSDGVKITTLTTGYYQKRYVGARRVI